jgi:hypothetical protein
MFKWLDFRLTLALPLIFAAPAHSVDDYFHPRLPPNQSSISDTNLKIDRDQSKANTDLKNDRDRFKAGTLSLPTLFNPKSAIQNSKWYKPLIL